MTFIFLKETMVLPERFLILIHTFELKNVWPQYHAKIATKFSIFYPIAIRMGEVRGITYFNECKFPESTRSAITPVFLAIAQGK